jgi:kynurenine 3-monooxygenase
MRTETHNQITIVGAGLVGSLLSIFLAKKGLSVQVIEKRKDPRQTQHQEGRSINLALSHRGLRALKEASADLHKTVLARSVPMYGRQMHDEAGKLSYQAYGSNQECIYSVSRAALNTCLIEEAEKHGVHFLFDHAIAHADVVHKQLHIRHAEQALTLNAPVLIAADGVFSVVRQAMEAHGVCKTQVERIGHGYKELDILPEQGQTIENQHALHIWPRGSYMFIALPNFDHSYTGTLFLPFEGETLSFKELQDPRDVREFFQLHFPDTLPLLPDLEKQYAQHPASFLGNVYTDRWSMDTWLLIGDAAHGIVPFYGQGMNAGFEDCRILNELLEAHHQHWSTAFQAFEAARKINTNAIARLAMDNFIEMRDLVADENFLLRKKIEAALSKALPEVWKSLYSEVTFSDTPYAEALAIGKRNDRIMQDVMNNANIDPKRWEEKEEWEKIVGLVVSFISC